MPCSCGRMHTLALDAESQVWTFRNWGRPFRLDTPLFTTTEGSTVVQVESGWMFCSALMDSGDVYVWWPFNNPIHTMHGAHMREMDQDETKAAKLSEDGVIPAVTWDLTYNPVKLPKLPDLPELEVDKDDSTEEKPALKLVKIAGMDNVLIGLTNRGHVVKFGGLTNEGNMQVNHWEYVSFITSIVRQH